MNNNKTIINQWGQYWSLLVMLGMVLCFSCTDDEDAVTGMPMIERIRNTDPSTADSSFVNATLGSTLAILGQNLGTTQEVYLNDYPLGVNPAYVTNSNVIVTVNDSVPTVATDPNVPNTLRLVTKGGETSIQFQTLPPAPQILRVSNQYVKPGDELTLVGRYFYFVDTVYFPGEDVFVTEGFSTNSTGTTLKVTVPDGVDYSDGSSVSMVTQSGGSAVNRNTQIYDGNGMVADFDTNGALEWPWGWGWGISGNMIVPSINGVMGIEGNFGAIEQELPANWGWNNDKVINFANWGGEQIFPTSPEDKYNPSAPIGNFDIRLEMAVNTTSSLEGINMDLWYPDSQGNELQVSVPLVNFITTTDGTWYTISVNASQLTSGNIRLGTYGDMLAGGADGVKQLRIVIQNTTGSDVPVVMGVDNVRIVRAAQ
ncbi:glycan-binding surface protein [Echinicola sp. 20G]|uniref:glycan-binding surface protein n=1 Tax=Echinicola sp. 20G TaxID=2781961 RepID=UPI001910C058|nr:glycan-binding surface protein [Echinicola sp. 20G]